MFSAENKSNRSWREIAAEASQEQDHEKLLVLTKELERALEERTKSLRVPSQPSTQETIEQKPTVRCDNSRA